MKKMTAKAEIKLHKSHFLGLQSLRGLAACVVLIHHSLFYFATTPTFRKLSAFLFNAHAAVVMFFVLSGFVLVRSLVKSEITSKAVVAFYFRRAFRIFPALWVAVAFASLYLVTAPNFSENLQVSTWFVAAYEKQIHASDFFRAMAGTGYVVLPPLWTIRTELMASLLLPTLAWFVIKGQKLILLLTMTMGAATLAASKLHSGAVMYMVDFAIGATLVRWTADSIMPRKKSYDLIITLTAALVLIFFRSINSNWDLEVDFGAVVPHLVEGGAAAVLILSVANGNRSLKILSLPILVYLGDISYSIYLLHFPALCLLGKLIGYYLPIFVSSNPDVGGLILAVATFMVTLPLSHFVYKLVEIPGIHLGNQILKKLLLSSNRK